MRTRVLLLAGLLLLLLVPAAGAEPTPLNRLILWDYSGPAVTGFRLYWAPQSEAAPRVYSDARRVDLADGGLRSIAVLDVKPDATSGLCFRLTAVNAVGHESAYSDEVCGFFGIPGVTNVRVQ